MLRRLSLATMASPLRRSTRSIAQKQADSTPSPSKRKFDETVDSNVDSPSPKKARAARTKAEPVYVIPEVVHKETTFKGRLGYACLNTILRNQKPAKTAVFCSRTCR